MLAACALAQGFRRFDEFVRARDDLARAIINEFRIGVFHIRQKQLHTEAEREALDQELEEFADEVLERFRLKQDTPGRIAERLVLLDLDRPKSPRQFLENLKYKLLEPATAYIEYVGEAPPGVSAAALYLLFEMLAKVE